jgi:hypothetical protein
MYADPGGCGQFMLNWQGKNWDPAVDGGSTQYFDSFCAALLAPGNRTSHVKIGDIIIPQIVLNYGSFVEAVRTLGSMSNESLIACSTFRTCAHHQTTWTTRVLLLKRRIQLLT